MSWPQDERMNFTYDALDQLTDTWPDASAQPGYSAQYRYTAIGNFTSKNEVGSANLNDYRYDFTASGCTTGQGVKPYAVRYAAAGYSYVYDCNGNMTSRTENNVTYSQQWTIENRLSRITDNGQDVYYTYDADGNRIKTPSGPPLRRHGQVQNGVTTIYVSPLYEKNLSTGEVTTYYFAGSQRIATPALYRRRFCAVHVCARTAEHQRGSSRIIPPSAPPLRGHGVGSTSLAVDNNGNEIANSRQKYYAVPRSAAEWVSFR
jgi:hypothetical protein